MGEMEGERGGRERDGGHGGQGDSGGGGMWSKIAKWWYLRRERCIWSWGRKENDNKGGKRMKVRIRGRQKR